MITRFKKKSVLISWGVSYIIFIFISLAILTVFCFFTVNTLRKEIMTSNDLLLSNVRGQIDSMIKGSKLLSEELSLNKTISRLQYMRGNHNTVDTYAIYEAHMTLKYFYKANPSIKNIYIYYRKNDIVISNNSTNDIDAFYRIYFNNTGIAYSDWEDILRTKYEAPSFFMAPTDNNYLFYAMSYPYMSYMDNYMTIIIEINKDKLYLNLDESAKLNKSQFFMQSSLNDTLPLSEHCELSKDLSYNELTWESEYAIKKIGSENIIVSYIASDVADWKYVVATHESIFWQHSYDMIKVTVLCAAAALIFGSIVMSLSLKHNYNPVNELIENLEKRFGISFNGNLNEYSHIRHIMDDVATEREHTKKQLELQKKALVSAMLSRLMRGNTTKFSNEEDLLYYTDGELSFDNYCIILFCIENFEGIDTGRAAQENLELLKEYELAQFILNNVVDEVMSDIHHISVEVDNIMAYIAVSGEDDNLRDILIEKSDRITGFIDEIYGFDVTASVSSTHHGLNEISDCFYEALAVMEYKYLLSNGQDAYVNLSETMRETDFYFPLQKEHKLAQAVKEGNTEGASAIIEELFGRNTVSGKVSAETYFFIMIAIIGTLIKAVANEKPAILAKILTDMNIIKCINSCTTPLSIKSETLYITQYIIEAAKKLEERTDGEDTFISKIIWFVEQNYSLMDLSVTYIADVLSVNAVQMSRLFRIKMKESLPDYINRYRIGQAKKIMEQGYNNLEELSEKVGYNNTKTLTRAFKKYTGMTPGKYAENEVEGTSKNARL